MIVQSYFNALNEINDAVDKLKIPVDVSDYNQMAKVVNSCIGTKFASAWGDLVVNMAIRAV